MKRILIIDDDPQTRRLMTATFEADYKIFEAGDGINGLRSVLNHHPDLVILDGRMPGLDGLAVLDAIKSNPQLAHILVVMLTGRGRFHDLEKGVKLGADAYFIKPVSPKSLKLWVLKNLESTELSSIIPAEMKPLV